MWTSPAGTSVDEDSRWRPVPQLHGKKQHIRALLIDRVLLQHQVGGARAAAALAALSLIETVCVSR